MKNLFLKLKNIYHLIQSLLANIYYAFPQRKLKLIGVTGTDGKTTTTQMIYHILKSNGFRVGYISTISAKIGDKDIDTGFHVTTPDPLVLPKYLKMMVDENIEYVIIESTSQGIHQNRLWGLKFNAVTITNIGSDHLDYHITWENYALAKAKLLNLTKEGGLAVLNRDDKKSAKFLSEYLKGIDEDELKQVWYGKDDISNIKSSFDGFEFNYENTDFHLPLIGKYNLENALASINICKKYLPLNHISEALSKFKTPIGRMEIIQKEPFVVIIDFAHTPHALISALKSIRDIQNDGRIISVFGCAGKRDKQRREMGKYAISLGDILVLTAEDPRDEKLFDINNEIIKYSKEVGGKLIKRFSNSKDLNNINYSDINNEINDINKVMQKPVFAFDEDTVNSRKNAIEFAINLAKPNDIVFITGKAHERSLAFGNKEYDWYDKDVVLEILNNSN